MTIKKFFLSFGLIIASAFYVLFSSQNSLSAIPLAPVTAGTSSPLAPGEPIAPGNSPAVPTAPPPRKTPTPSLTPVPTPAPVPPPKPKGLYNDGSYTGDLADAYYGIVQVQAIIQGGRIADVRFLQYPNDRSTSRHINGQAMPYLTQEAIQAQNANVDIVSGATDTSMAFQQSLASALVKAKG